MSALPQSLLVALLLAVSTAPAAAQTPDAGGDRRITLGEDFSLKGVVEGQDPLVFWMADGNGPFEDMLVRYHAVEGISGVGPLRMVDGKGLGWPGDLVRIGDRVHGVDVGQRRIYVVDLKSGRCLAVTPQLSGQWKMLQSLAYDPEEDQLFAFDPVTSQLLSIARGSGTVTRIDAPELNGRRAVRSLAFEPELGLLFAVDSDAQQLLVVDPELGVLAGTMALPIPEDSQIEELQFFKGELYALLGYLEAGELVAGQLLRVNIKTGGISHVGPRVEDVSPHALLIDSVPQRTSWRQLAGPGRAELEFTSMLETAVTFPVPGTYEFELIVYADSEKLRDQVSIEVLPTDCNANGIHDPEDIATGRSLDRNQDGVPDECEVERGYVARFESTSAAGWVGVTVVPEPSTPAQDSAPAPAWLGEAVLFRASPFAFSGSALGSVRRCIPFDLGALHPRLRRPGTLTLDGRMVGVELVLGLWHPAERQTCATPGAPERDFTLAVSL